MRSGDVKGANAYVRRQSAKASKGRVEKLETSLKNAAKQQAAILDEGKEATRVLIRDALAWDRGGTPPTDRR